MRIVVLQLARLGDIIQTLPAIQGLKKARPDCEITLVTRATFADAARLSPHVDKLVEFPTRHVLEPALSETSDRDESLARLGRWIETEFGEAEYDLLLNLTFSPASSYLASLIKAKDRRGVLASGPQAGYHYVIHDLWSQYFFSQVVEHNMNIIHVNDLFTRIAGVAEGCWPLQLSEPQLASPVPASRPGRHRIGVQLTASSPEKTLNVESWGAVLRLVLTTHDDADLVFFGSAADATTIDAVLAETEKQAPGLTAGRFVTLAGTLRFHENVPWVRSCEWIIAPDTAIVHLASACGTRVIEIPLGGVKPEETGPYGDGHHIVYVAGANANQLGLEIARIIGGEKARPIVAEAVTKLTPTTSGTKRSELVPHNFIQDETSNFFMQAYYLLAEFRCAGRQEDIAIPKLGQSGDPTALDKLVLAYDALCTIRKLSEFGQHYCVKMLNNIENPDELRAEMAKLAELEEMMARLEKSIPFVKPLVDTWRVAKDVAYSPAVDSGSLEGILVLTEGCYRELGQNVEIVQQLLQTSVEAAKKATKIATKDLPKEEGL